MSELRVAEIHNPNDQTGGITIDNNDNVSINGQVLPAEGSFSNRNLIINGAMQVAQRATELTDLSGAGYRTLDRYRVSTNSLGTHRYTHEQVDDDAPDGFGIRTKSHDHNGSRQCC